jgi:hypothetical protein
MSAWVGTAEGGDAIGGGSSRGVGAAAEDGGDFGVGQPGEIVVGDSLFLLGGQLGQCLGQFGGVRLAVAGERGRCGIWCLGDGDRTARGRAGNVDGLAVGDGHEPRFDVGVGRKIGVGLHRGQEGFRPGVVGIRGAKDGPADAQHGASVREDDSLERLLACHGLKTSIVSVS